jgi:hypothetical protein
MRQFKRVGSATYQAKRHARYARGRGRALRCGRSRCRARSARQPPTIYCGPAGVYANRERPPKPFGRRGSSAAADAKPGADRRAGHAGGLQSYQRSQCYRARAGWSTSSSASGVQCSLMQQTRVSQPRLSNFHAVNGYLPPLSAARMRSRRQAHAYKGGEGGIKQIARFRCALDSRVAADSALGAEHTRNLVAAVGDTR